MPKAIGYAAFEDYQSARPSWFARRCEASSGDAPKTALLTMRVQDFAAKQDLIPTSPPKAGVSKDGPQ
jgi:hypothetical protein